MNKSFKVVFSKARSALMVVNEATSSIQAKGTKTVIAAAAAAMIAGGAVAATTSIVKDAATLRDGTAYNSYTSDKASKTDNDFGALYVDGRGATTAVSGSAVNLSFTNNTSSGKAGALALDEASLTLRDAQFSNNSAAGWGGAVRLWGTSASRSALELKTTRDLTYAGNKAGQGKTAGESGATALGDRYEDMGGFAHLQGNSTLTLNAAANTTLTIGETGAAKTAGLDSITTSYGGNTLEINGAGTVNLNGSLEGFVGAINVSGGTVNMATGFGSIDNETQSNVNSQTANASGATAGNVQSVLKVTSGATVNMGALTINRSTKTGETKQVGTQLKVEKDSKLYVESITLGTKEYEDKYQKSSTEELASGSKKTTGYGAVDVASGAVAEVKKDVTVAAGTTFDKTGSGAFTVLGTLKTVAAVSGGAAAGVFNVSGGSVDVNKVTNDGTTNVASGASFSVTGTGSVNSGTISIVGTTGTNTTAGSLTVAKGADFVNTGFISGKANKAENNKTTYTADNAGDVIVAGTFTNYGTVDGKTVNGYIGANSLTVEEGGVLNTKITDSYAVAKTTVKGTFNLTELTSIVSGKETDPKDQLALAGEMTLDGGLVTLNGQEFTGNVKLGLSTDKPATFVVKGARDYKASQITFLQKGQSENNGSTLTLDADYEGTYTVGTLDAVHADSVEVKGGTLNVDTKLTTNATGDNVHVRKDGTLALTKTAIGLTVATSGKTETFAVADTGVCRFLCLARVYG